MGDAVTVRSTDLRAPICPADSEPVRRKATERMCAGVTIWRKKDGNRCFKEGSH